MARVLILGSNGMLGSMIRRVFDSSNHQLFITDRVGGDGSVRFVVGEDDPERLIREIGGVDFILNAVGVIKPRIDESDIQSRLTAINVNGVFPHELARAASVAGSHVIQIATDCVYSGTQSLYKESALHDPTDIYGKSKSLGEVPSENVLHIRASIIGPEIGRQTSLWEWVRSQPDNATIGGYTNHLWNGVSTYHFACVCLGLVDNNARFSGTRHLVPADIVTKSTLVRAIAHASGRQDINVNDTVAKDTIDRTLSTDFPDFSRQLWNLAGYAEPPTVRQMVAETPLNQ